VQCGCSIVRACKGKGNICVIGEIRNYFETKEIMVFDVRPVSSGNKVMYHLLEVAYLFEKMMEYVEDKELNTVNLDRLICKQKETIVNQKGGLTKSNGE
jgi:hypothetical protein